MENIPQTPPVSTPPTPTPSVVSTTSQGAEYIWLMRIGIAIGILVGLIVLVLLLAVLYGAIIGLKESIQGDW